MTLQNFSEELIEKEVKQIMTNFKKQMFSVMASGMLVLNIASPVLADNSIEITGNGNNSNNTANVVMTSNNSVVQDNNAHVTNNIRVDADTGKNDANGNNGGDVTITTGNATTTTNVSNNLNHNQANLDCCPVGNTTVNISDNGNYSNNTVNLTQGNNNDVYQDNYARVNNYVNSDADTGKNDANGNNGGDVTIHTGNASTTTNVSTNANANVATLGGNGNGGNSGVSAYITGNGNNSKNTIDLGLVNSAYVEQENDAHVTNRVYSDADTGKNDANGNNGGEVTITTGNAESNVGIDNNVNFNAANLDCGCLLTGNFKIGENGNDSNNTIKAVLADNRNVFQGGDGLGNDACLYNDVDADADTGKNDSDGNNGENNGDPATHTGNAKSNVNVENNANQNVVGDFDMDDWDMDWGHGFDFSFSFDLSDLLEALGVV